MRLMLVLIGAYHGANGVVMLAAPELWFANGGCRVQRMSQRCSRETSFT